MTIRAIQANTMGDQGKAFLEQIEKVGPTEAQVQRQLDGLLAGDQLASLA